MYSIGFPSSVYVSSSKNLILSGFTETGFAFIQEDYRAIWLSVLSLELHVFMETMHSLFWCKKYEIAIYSRSNIIFLFSCILLALVVIWCSTSWKFGISRCHTEWFIRVGPLTAAAAWHAGMRQEGLSPFLSVSCPLTGAWNLALL